MRIAIVGSIASGKTTLLNGVKEKGCKVYFGDELVANLYKDEQLKEDLTTEFGTNDKSQIKEIVFNDYDKKKKLEEIFDKYLRVIIQDLVNANENIIMELPLLYEYCYEDMFDKVVLVYADEYTQLERVISRDNLDSIDQAYKVINALPKNDDLMKKVDITLESEDDFEDNVNKIVELYLEKKC